MGRPFEALAEIGRIDVSGAFHERVLKAAAEGNVVLAQEAVNAILALDANHPLVAARDLGVRGLAPALVTQVLASLAKAGLQFPPAPQSYSDILGLHRPQP